MKAVALLVELRILDRASLRGRLRVDGAGPAGDGDAAARNRAIRVLRGLRRALQDARQRDRERNTHELPHTPSIWMKTPAIITLARRDCGSGSRRQPRRAARR